MTNRHIPSLASSTVVIRLPASRAEVEAANRLVYENYVNLYWPEDEEAFSNNKYLTSPARHMGVAVESGNILATMSAIEDSPMGLPSDTFQPAILSRLRRRHRRIAEMSSFAVTRAVSGGTVLSLYLMKFFMQYSFYYLGLDCLIASCRPKHADFYRHRLCFEKLCDPLPHPYAGGMKCQFISLDLLKAHLLLSERYETADDQANFYHFLYVDEDENVRFPAHKPLQRSRNTNWAAIAKHRELPVAV